MRVAVVHEWMDSYAGSERVVEQILAVFPEADLFTICDFLSPQNREFLNGRQPTTSFIQRLPFAKNHFRNYLPLMPFAMEQFDLSAYDLVLSSSHAFAKGVLTGPLQTHICYCHTPIRYAWDLQHQYLNEAGLTRGLKSLVARATLHYVRLWDSRTSHGVDHFVANSSYIAARIRKVYSREATVIHPPVDTRSFTLEKKKDSFYLAASRFVPYKRMDVIIRAFTSRRDRKLVVVGDGPELKKCQGLATANIEILGYQSAEVLRNLMQRARGLVFAAEEDFGIIPVEAQACGTPVLCYGRGGATDSVIPGLTGMYFDRQEPESICNALDAFEELDFDPTIVRTHAEKFSPDVFRQSFADFVSSKISTERRQPSMKQITL